MAEAETHRKIRAAAYIRVSTEKEIQQTSFAAQIAQFQKTIRERENWEAAGIYLDYGVSGTGREARIGFERMIRHCREGKIDRIFTRSVSRFARNSETLLKTVEELKEQEIFVYFENENLDTQRGEDLFVLSVMSAVAEQEARSISENIRWGVKKRFEKGDAHFCRIYGYGIEKEQGKQQTRKIYAVEPEADVVRLIFREAELGKTPTQIARYLNEKRVPPPVSSGTFQSRRLERLKEVTEHLPIIMKSGWMMHHVIAILKNERYTGEALCQKTCMDGTLRKHSVRNNGQEVQYLIQNHHPALVSKEQYKKANKAVEMAKRRPHTQGKRYALTRRILCPLCGCYYNRCTNTGKEPQNVIWCCYSRLRQVDGYRCIGGKYRTGYLERAVTIMFHERFFSERDRKGDFYDSLYERGWKSGNEEGVLHRLKEYYKKRGFFQEYEEEQLYFWCRSRILGEDERWRKLNQDRHRDLRDWDRQMDALRWLEQKAVQEKQQRAKQGNSYLKCISDEAVRYYLEGWVTMILPYSQEHIAVCWFDGRITERYFSGKEVKKLQEGLANNIR